MVIPADSDVGLAHVVGRAMVTLFVAEGSPIRIYAVLGHLACKAQHEILAPHFRTKAPIKRSAALPLIEVYLDGQQRQTERFTDNGVGCFMNCESVVAV